MKITLVYLLALVLAHAASPLSAQSIAFEDFGDGGAPDTGGWTTGPTGAAVADAGENGVGDHALLYGSSTGGMHTFNNTPAFTGDYAGQNAGVLEFRARHTGVGDSVELRVFLFNGNFGQGGDHAVSSTVASIANTSTAWELYSIPLAAPDLDLIQGSLNGLLSGVTQIGLRHDPGGEGATVLDPLNEPTDVFFDDIRLGRVPEPTTFGLLPSLGFLALARRRRGC